MEYCYEPEMEEVAFAYIEHCILSFVLQIFAVICLEFLYYIFVCSCNFSDWK